jgi:NADH:ubiquinone oxidoreductase subunit 5 (subunit L)/multisubunit Na+/H+ antiporter MnhA subunit
MPIFITPPGSTDILMAVTAVFLAVVVVAFGLLFLRLHSLPERMAHRGHKLQFEVVAVLCLIALFTHIHAFWIAALLLALIDFPDIGDWMRRIAGGVERIAGMRSAEDSTEPSPKEGRVDRKMGESVVTLSGETKSRSLKDREPTRA